MSDKINELNEKQLEQVIGGYIVPPAVPVIPPRPY